MNGKKKEPENEISVIINFINTEIKKNQKMLNSERTRKIVDQSFKTTFWFSPS